MVTKNYYFVHFHMQEEESISCTVVHTLIPKPNFHFISDSGKGTDSFNIISYQSDFILTPKLTGNIAFWLWCLARCFTTKMKVDVSLAQDKPCTQTGCFPST